MNLDFLSLDLTALAVAIISAMGGLFAVLQARAANRRATSLEARKVDLDTQREHWDRTDAIIERLAAEVERLDASLARAREEMDKATSDNTVLRARIAQAEVHIARLKSMVVTLAAEMTDRGFVPSVNLDGLET